MKIVCHNCKGTGTQYILEKVILKEEYGITLPAYSVEKEVKCCICNGIGLVEAGYRNILLKKKREEDNTGKVTEETKILNG